MAKTFTVEDFKIVLPTSTSLKGNTGLEFSGFAPILEGGKQDVSWIKADAKQKDELINNTQVGAVVCDTETYDQYKGTAAETLFIITETPKTTFYKILGHIHAPASGNAEIHATAIVHPGCKLGKNVSIGAYAIVDQCEIGDNTIIHDHVKIHDRVFIGSNCVIREFCSIGGPGFGIVQDDDGNNMHVPHIGRVVIKDNVMILPFSNVDKGTLGDTTIDEYTCIDHYCHIGHNTKTGKNNIITAGTIMAGGSQIGDNCFIGVRTTVKEKAIIGSGVTTGMASNVINNIPDNQTWIGNPAMEMQAFLKWRKFMKEKLGE